MNSSYPNPPDGTHLLGGAGDDDEQLYSWGWTWNYADFDEALWVADDDGSGNAWGRIAISKRWFRRNGLTIVDALPEYDTNPTDYVYTYESNIEDMSIGGGGFTNDKNFTTRAVGTLPDDKPRYGTILPKHFDTIQPSWLWACDTTSQQTDGDYEGFVGMNDYCINNFFSETL